MSAGDDDEVYSDVPSNAPVTDMRLKIAMFNKPTGNQPSATKPKLSAQPSRPTNIVGPKPPMNIPPMNVPPKNVPPKNIPPKKQFVQHKSPPTPVGPPSAATNGKPVPRVAPLSPKTSANEGASASNGGGLPSPVRQSIFHQADRELKTSGTKSPQPSPTIKSSGQNHTLYPPDKVETDHATPPTLPTRTPGMTLVRAAGGQTYRKLSFVVPKGSAPAKPPKPPADLTTKLGDKMADVEEVYEDGSSYRIEAEDADEYVEEEYEEVGAFAEAFRRQQEVTNYDDELYDDINVTT